MTTDDTGGPVDPRAALDTAVVETRARIDRLERDLTRLHDASRDSNADDEHDPEGHTIAFERQQLVAVLDDARRRAGALAAAVARAEVGTYGECVSCGHPIASARLAARPDALTCISCARTG